MTRTCKFGCPVLLGEWNDNARKYHEAASGELHTRERCEEAKARARQTQGEKNNHGNEESKPISPKEYVERLEYVDHTLAGIPQIITIVAESAEEMDDLANSWLKKEASRIRFKGGQRAYRSHDDKHEITLYYEEISK